MAHVDDLITLRDNLVSTLITESANPKPSYSISGHGGRSFSWNEYRQSLLDQIKDLEVLISDLSPYIISTRHTVRG